MSKLARLPRFGGSAEAAPGASHQLRLRTRYYAFLSYSHKDKELADWLHRSLERFRVPSALAGTLTANGVVPKRLTPIFRDQQDLSAGGDLGEEIKAALAASQFLIVLCSPAAAKSRWTNAEIESFKRTRPEGCILAAVAAGEPFASDIPGREDEECFPPALRLKFDRRGHATTRRAEPLAADFREAGEGQRLAFLKVVAGMLGVGLDDLAQRETTRRHRRLAWLTAASLAGMAVTSTLAVVALQARDSARDQRREAEGLVAFMLGDLKDKLEPIGRLDALDGVGARVLAYYRKQGTDDLSDAALLQRARALSLTAQVAFLRGHLEDSERLYREAISGTSEAIRRQPDDAKRLFDQAQSYFYLGEIARDRGDLAAAEADYREYQRLANRMVAIEPDNLKWRMETEYAQANVGIVLYNQRRFSEAARQFEGALHTIDALSSVDPANPDYQESRVQSLAWLADSRRSEGRLNDAIAIRERLVELLDKLTGSQRDVAFKQWAIPAHEALGNLYASRNRLNDALIQLRQAVDTAEGLIPIEPTNDLWKRLAANARLDLAKVLLAGGDHAAAAEQISAGCNLVPNPGKAAVGVWGIVQRECLAGQARSALASTDKAAARVFAQEALAAAQSDRSLDPISKRYALAAAYRLLGDIRNGSGDTAGARSDWSNGLALLNVKVNERPQETYEHAELSRRLGLIGQTRPLDERLKAMGYRSLI